MWSRSCSILGTLFPGIRQSSDARNRGPEAPDTYELLVLCTAKTYKSFHLLFIHTYIQGEISKPSYINYIILYCIFLQRSNNRTVYLLRVVYMIHEYNICILDYILCTYYDQIGADTFSQDDKDHDDYVFKWWVMKKIIVCLFERNSYRSFTTTNLRFLGSRNDSIVLFKFNEKSLFLWRLYRRLNRSRFHFL